MDTLTLSFTEEHPRLGPGKEAIIKVTHVPGENALTYQGTVGGQPIEPIGIRLTPHDRDNPSIPTPRNLGQRTVLALQLVAAERSFVNFVRNLPPPNGPAA